MKKEIEAFVNACCDFVPIPVAAVSFRICRCNRFGFTDSFLQLSQQMD